jgi:phytoene dehydrogenase-like protein
MKGNIKQEEGYQDLYPLLKDYTGQSVWRLKNGTEELINKLAENLLNEENVKIHLNEPIVSLEFDDSKTEKSVKLKSKSTEDNFDIVISSIYSPCKFESLN